MLFLGNNIFYTDVSKIYKTSSCGLLRVFVIYFTRSVAFERCRLYKELMIYANKPERACPKGHDRCGGASTSLARRRASDSRRDTVIRPTGIDHVCLPSYRMAVVWIKYKHDK